MLLRAAISCFLLASVFSVGGCASVAPGQQAIDSVSVRGAKAIDESEVEDKLATEASPKFLGVFGGVIYDYQIFNEATLQRDLARVERYYQARGYYSAHARAGRVIKAGDRHVRVEIVVEEGPPTVNGDIVVEGIESLPRAVQADVRAAARAALPRGDPFQEDAAERCGGDARKALTDAGYAYATVKRDTYVDIVHRTAHTTIALTPGDTATFGAITIEGLDPDGAGPRPQDVPEAPLRRAIDVAPGEPYSTARIDAATKAILDLGVFAAVTIVPDVSHPETRVVPITVHAEPTRLRAVRVGGGIEFDEIKTELHLIGGWEDHNFLGGLRDFSANFQPGLVLYPTRVDNFVRPDHLFPAEKLRLQLKQPGFIEARTEGFIRPELNVFPLLVQTNPSPTDPVVGYREVKGAAGVDRILFRRLYVNLSYDAQVEDPFSYKGALDPDLNRLVVLYPELITRIDFRDDHDHPHAGVYLANDLQFAGGVFGGGPRDVRVQPEVRTYVPVSHKVTLATRASMGFLMASNYGDVVQNHLSDPVTAANRRERVSDIQTVLFRGFFSGGSTSNRGFPLRGVAPHGIVPFLNPSTASQQVALNCAPSSPSSGTPVAGNNPTQPNPDVCSVPIGGFTLWEFSNELRFEVKGPLSGATFCDMGDVSPRQVGQSQSIRLSHLHLSCGIGVRYDTAVGPLRLDVGYRIQPLQVLGYANETAAYNADHSNGLQPTFFGGSTPGSGIPVAIAIGIGEAY